MIESINIINTEQLLGYKIINFTAAVFFFHPLKHVYHKDFK